MLLPASVIRALPGYKLKCSAFGTRPIYTALLTNSRVLVNTTETAMIDLNKEGDYACVVSSKYGTDSKEFSVIFTGIVFGPF